MPFIFSDADDYKDEDINCLSEKVENLKTKLSNAELENSKLKTENKELKEKLQTYREKDKSCLYVPSDCGHVASTAGMALCGERHQCFSMFDPYGMSTDCTCTTLEIKCPKCKKIVEEQDLILDPSYKRKILLAMETKKKKGNKHANSNSKCCHRRHGV